MTTYQAQSYYILAETKYITIFRALALAVAFAPFATILPATPALAAIITTVSPDSGKPGDSIAIVGDGFSRENGWW